MTRWGGRGFARPLARVRIARPARIAGPARALLAALLVVLAATAVAAFVPQAERVVGAIAKSNADSGRAQALRIKLEMRLGEGPLVARGELVTHPTGMARLELRGAGDLVERHLLQGSEHTAGRNGAFLPEPRALLPPLFLLQIDSAVSLRAALEAFQIQADLIGLAPCDENDCYVLGDSDHVAPRPDAPPGAAEAEQDEGVSLRERGGFFGLGAKSEDETETQAGFGLLHGQRPATLWADMGSFDVRRVQLAGGVRILFGPYVMFERVRAPSWLQIEEERGSVHFDVVDVTPVNAPASAFDAEWIVAPSTSPPAPGRFPAGSPDGPGSPGDDQGEESPTLP